MSNICRSVYRALVRCLTELLRYSRDDRLVKQWIECLRYGMHISDDIESLRDVASRKREAKASVIEKRVSNSKDIFLAWGVACVIGVRG